MLDRSEKARVTKSADSARQGVTGHNVRWVLAISLLAVVVCFAALLIAFTAH
jgi:hypothetical protein